MKLKSATFKQSVVTTYLEWKWNTIFQVNNLLGLLISISEDSIMEQSLKLSNFFYLPVTFYWFHFISTFHQRKIKKHLLKVSNQLMT